MSERVRIDRLGHRGDGVAETADGALFVGRALAGELAEVERYGPRAKLLAVVEASPDRVEAYCPEVGHCGGCAVQEFAQPAALAWKRALLIDAFAREGLDVAAITDPCIDAHGAGRRRATFHARSNPDGRVSVGFAEARSHAIAAIAGCPLLAPGMARALPASRAVAQALATRKKPLDLAVTTTAAGLDMDVRGSGPIPEAMRLRLVALAEKLDLARLAIHGDVVVERRKPLLTMGLANVAPPPGAFLQATEAAEDILATLAREGIGGAKRIADLFSGVGTFALRLADKAEVLAVESDKPAIAALDAAARTARGLRRIRTEARDLFRRPLAGPELAGLDAVVFDPPRAGAEAQSRMLAEAKVPRVVAVSCSVATLARDAAILIRGGYALERVTPVDQFRHSAHVEAVAVFRR